MMRSEFNVDLPLPLLKMNDLLGLLQPTLQSSREQIELGKLSVSHDSHDHRHNLFVLLQGMEIACQLS
jgi:hypothetical protein